MHNDPAEPRNLPAMPSLRVALPCEDSRCRFAESKGWGLRRGRFLFQDMQAASLGANARAPVARRKSPNGTLSTEQEV